MTTRGQIELEAKMLLLGLRLQATGYGGGHHPFGVVNAEDESECFRAFETLDEVRQFVEGFECAWRLVWKPMQFKGAPLVWDSERERAEIRRLKRENDELRGRLECIASGEFVRVQTPCGCAASARSTLDRIAYAKKCSAETPAEQADPGFQGDHDTGV